MWFNGGEHVSDQTEKYGDGKSWRARTVNENGYRTKADAAL